MTGFGSAFELIKRVVLLTILGFLVVVAAGPVFAVLSVILPFTLVGFAIWLPYRVFYQGKPINWAGVRHTAETVCRIVFGVPAWIGGKVWHGAGWALHSAGRVVHGSFVLTRRIFFETVAGASVGGILGAIGAMEHQDAAIRIPLGAAIGAGVGILVALFWSESKPKRVLAHTA